MKILYDHQIFSLQKYGGISRYFCELLTRFTDVPANEFSIALRISLNEYLLGSQKLDSFWSNKSSIQENARMVAMANATARNERIGILQTNALSWLNQRESERLLKQQNFDLLHPTYYNPYFTKLLGGKPYVITVYDMIHEIYPDYFPRKDPIVAWKRQVLEEADAVIAISASTKKDIVRLLHTDPDRIRVIHLGISLVEKPDMIPSTQPHPSAAKKPYLLFVGNRAGYKNFDLFLRASAGILHRERDLKISCAGGGAFTERESALFRDLEIAGRVEHVQTDDRGMQLLYRQALAFIFPSLYEGFGLPVLEAFSSNCPVILSNTSSLPEVGGDAALYFDPSDQNSLTLALERVLTDQDLREQLILRGRERAKAFSWEKTAQATADLYKTLVNV
jgi:glycosyltransferase involved in cell wall biosynthesis